MWEIGQYEHFHFRRVTKTHNYSGNHPLYSIVFLPSVTEIWLNMESCRSYGHIHFASLGKTPQNCWISLVWDGNTQCEELPPSTNPLILTSAGYLNVKPGVNDLSSKVGLTWTCFSSEDHILKRTISQILPYKHAQFHFQVAICYALGWLSNHLSELFRNYPTKMIKVNQNLGSIWRA